MKRNAALIIIFLFLALGLAIYGIFRYEAPTSASTTAVETAAVMPTASVTFTPVPTATPTPTPLPTMPPTPSPTPSPTPTALPTAKPTPTSTAAPTEAPSPTPTLPPGATAVPLALNSIDGSFRTETGTFLNLIVKYSIEQNGADTKLCLYAFSESYSLESGIRENDLRFLVDGVSAYASTGPIIVTDNSALSETFLGKAEFTVLPGSTVRADVSWSFNGVMSGKQLNVLTASATISIP